MIAGQSRGTANSPIGRAIAISSVTTRAEFSLRSPRLRARFDGRTDEPKFEPRTIVPPASADPKAGRLNSIKLVNLVKTADDLVPFGRNSVSMGMLVWQALQRETEDPRALLSLDDADIERLWRIADGAQRDHRTEDYRIWDDLPSMNEKHSSTAGRAAVQFQARTTGSTIMSRFQRYTLSCGDGAFSGDGGKEVGDDNDDAGVFMGCVDGNFFNPLLSRLFPFLPEMRPRQFKALVGTALAGAGMCDMVFEYDAVDPKRKKNRRSVDIERQFVRVAGPKVFVAMDPHAGRFTLLVRTS